MIKSVLGKKGSSLIRLSILAGLFSIMVSCSGSGGDIYIYPANDHLFAVAIQNDGKIVVAGDSYKNYWSSVLMRFNSNGSLDASFGAGGKVLGVGSCHVRAITIQSDAKILVAGYNADTGDFVLIRYNSNGHLDTSFGISGTVQTVVSQSGDGGVLATAIQNDGKIVAAGYSYNGVGYDFALTRYDMNGIRDTTFGLDGIVITKVTAYLVTGYVISRVVIQPDDKIVAAGGSYLIRYNTDGSLDASFGLSGEVVTDSYYEHTSGVAIQVDGKIVAAGSSYNGMGSYDFALTRYNGDGSPDTTFADNGRALSSVMSLYPLEPANVVPDPISGKIVAAGFSQYQFVVTRYTSDGTPDTTFADDGKIITTGYDYWGGSNCSVNDFAVQADGKIVVVGSTYENDTKGNDFALSRHNSDGSIDMNFGRGGKVTAGM